MNWVVTDWYRPEQYYSSSAWHATWETDGGGVLLNQCPHNLDILQWICGMPKYVQGFCKEGHFHDIEVEDDVTAYVEWENGATGTLITSTGDAWDDGGAVPEAVYGLFPQDKRYVDAACSRERRNAV